MLNKEQKEEIKKIVYDIIKQPDVDNSNQLEGKLKEKGYDLKNRGVAVYIFKLIKEAKKEEDKKTK